MVNKHVFVLGPGHGDVNHGDVVNGGINHLGMWGALIH